MKSVLCKTFKPSPSQENIFPEDSAHQSREEGDLKEDSVELQGGLGGSKSPSKIKRMTRHPPN